MYSYARAHIFATTVSTIPSSTIGVSTSSSSNDVLKSYKSYNTATSNLPQTSRHRGSGGGQVNTVPASTFIGEFTYPGEVNSSALSTSPIPNNSSTITTTAAASIRPSAPGQVDDEQYLTQIEIPQIPAQSQKKSNANLIERDPDMANPKQRHTEIHVVPNRIDTKQIAQTYTLDDDTLKQYREAFRLFDRNNDGCITSQELGTVMKSLGIHPSDSELQDMIDEVDVDGSGTIEFDEFVQMMTRRMIDKQDGDEEELKEAFEVFDRNKDGFISAEELRMVMRSLGENLTDQELNEMMRAADANGDGIINFNEFQEVWLEASQVKK